MADPRTEEGRSKKPRLLPKLFPTNPTRIGSVDRIAGLLWQGEPSSIVVTRDAAPPDGYRTIDAYAIVPSARHPHYFLPLASRTAASQAVRAYGSLRTGTRRAAGFAAAMGLRIGLAQIMLRDCVYVHASRRVPDAELGKVSLMHHVARLLDQERVTGMISLGSAGPYAKPVIQVLSTRGEAMGFVKVGWDEISTHLVKNEARALGLCARTSLRTLRVPRLLYSGSWNQLELSVASPLPEDVRRYPDGQLPPLAITDEICSLTGTTPRPLWGSPYASRLDGWAGDVTMGAAGRALPGALSWLRQRFPEACLRFGAWHGDWVPWNLATRGSALYAWDWEYSSDEVPLGFDVVHFFFHSALVGEGRALPEAVRRARTASAEPLRQLGVPEPLAGLVLALYLVEASFRAEDVIRFGGTPNPRIYPGIVAALDRLPHII